MENIFLTNNCVLIIYPPGASGKFLINCLSMHSSFVFQDVKSLVYNTPQLRFEVLTKEIESYKKIKNKVWNDLNLGDMTFFGIENYQNKNFSDPSHYQTHLLSKKFNVKCIKKLIEDNKLFFRVCHGQDAYSFYRDVWPNSKQILFENCEQWIKIRNKGNLNFEIMPSTNLVKGNYYQFNCMSFVQKKDFIKEYVNLINQFSLTEENLDLVSILYDKYMSINFN